MENARKVRQRILKADPDAASTPRQIDLLGDIKMKESDNNSTVDTDEGYMWTNVSSPTTEPISLYRQRRDELLYLRAQVPVLEQKLQQLRHKLCVQMATHSGATATPPPNSEHEEEDAVSIDAKLPPQHPSKMWEDIATRQMLRRKELELENAKLKAAIKAQLRLMDNFQKLLIKHTRAENLDAIIHQNQLTHTVNDIQDAQLFEEMVTAMDGLHACVDQVFASRDMRQPETIFRNSQVKFDDKRGLHLEFLERNVVPFEADVACRALWRLMAGERRATDDQSNIYEEQSESTGTIIRRSYNTRIENNRHNMQLRSTLTVQKFVEDCRVVVVWKALVTPQEQSGKPTNDMIFDESGWAIIQSLQYTDGPRTSLQSCCLMTPSAMGDPNKQNLKVGTLVESMLTTYNVRIDISHEYLENLLFDEAAANTAHRPQVHQNNRTALQRA